MTFRHPLSQGYLAPDNHIIEKITVVLNNYVVLPSNRLKALFHQPRIGF